MIYGLAVSAKPQHNSPKAQGRDISRPYRGKAKSLELKHAFPPDIGRRRCGGLARRRDTENAEV